MRSYDSIAALATGGLLVYVAVSGKAPGLWALVREDAPGYAKWAVASALVLVITRSLPGKAGALGEALVTVAGVGLALAATPGVAREVKLIYGKG